MNLWPFRKRPAPTPQWARDVVATVSRADLPSAIHTFAEQALKTKDPAVRAMHWAKFVAGVERLAAEDALPRDEEGRPVFVHSIAIQDEPEIDSYEPARPHPLGGSEACCLGCGFRFAPSSLDRWMARGEGPFCEGCFRKRMPLTAEPAGEGNFIDTSAPPASFRAIPAPVGHRVSECDCPICQLARAGAI